MRVAFVDDDPNELKILHTYFNDLTDPSTISIDDFSSGEEFLSRFTAGLYDLVILDIFMGDLTGVDVARKIRETDHNVRLVFCTTSNDFASESYEVAACYYLHKPYTETNVKSMLDRLVRKESWNAPALFPYQTVSLSCFVTSFMPTIPPTEWFSTVRKVVILSPGFLLQKSSQNYVLTLIFTVLPVVSYNATCISYHRSMHICTS